MIRSGVLLMLSMLAAWPFAEAETLPTEPRTPIEWQDEISKLRNELGRAPGRDGLIKQQLALAYNNYGVVLAEQNRLDDALLQLEEALELDPDRANYRANAVRLRLRVAQEAAKTRQIDRAREQIQMALELDPRSAEAYSLLGEVEYHAQRLKEAKAAWEKAVAIDPNVDGVAQRLKRVTEELPVESKFEKLSQFHFDIRYTGALDRSAGYDMQSTLQTARREVGSDFSFWPKRKIIVLVYSMEEFRRLRQDAPEWAGGQYDGKIRVPLPAKAADQELVMRILRHEYTHAVIHELVGPDCPAWLNEGLAEYESWKGGDPPWNMLRRSQTLPWAALMATPFDNFSTSQAQLAYEQSHSIVAYLVDRYSFWRVRRILEAVGKGTSADQALVTQLHTKLPRLESQWKEWLAERIGTSPE